MKVAVTGANGQLGGELCKRLGNDAVALKRPDFDLNDSESIRNCLKQIKPDVVINAAAYTAVDKAEEEVEACQSVNADSVKVIAETCRELDCKLVQISTDYVFEGYSFENSGLRKPFDETVVPQNPGGVYAKTKWQGEKNAAAWKKYFVVRTCGLYSLDDSGPIRGRNFVDTMISLGAERDELGIVSDQHCTPTYVPHLVQFLTELIKTDEYGLYHVTNSGGTTWFEFAAEIFARAKQDVQLNAITTEEFGAPAPRPAYSILNTNKIENLIGEMPSWKDGLSDYFQKLESLSQLTN